MYREKFISAVIVAAGSSTRMKSTVSKQLMPLLGKPVLLHTLSAFLSCEIIDEIIVVCPIGDAEYFKSVLDIENSNVPIKFTEGGKTRQESVFNGVSLTDDRTELVAVHDGARPLITPELIKSAVECSAEHSAATLAVPVKDTVKFVENDIIASTPERDKLRAIQTPQVFEKGLYLSAFNKAGENGLDFTDDCQLVEYYGREVFTVMGDYSNIKITTSEDIAIAEALLRLRGESK